MTGTENYEYHRGLSRTVISLATSLLGTGGWTVVDDAPSTLEDLKAAVGWPRIANPIPVFSGGCDRTIFASPEANHAFRAWHDYRHLTLDAPFTAEGEAAVCEAQIFDLAAYSGGLIDPWFAFAAQILRAEVIGQGLHLRRHGVFPRDQLAFVNAYLINPERALERVW